MVTQSTILSKNDAKLLEDTIVRYGRIVSFDQLRDLAKNKYATTQGIKERVSFLLKAGWLVGIKKGLYVIISDFSSLSFNDISGMAIAQALNKDSYVSFENALQYHGMFDQMITTVDSVTFLRARKYEMQNIKVRFFKIKKELFFGYSKQNSDNGTVNIADKEKALLDMLYFRSSSYNISLIMEKLKEYKNDLDILLLKKHASKFGTNFIRKIGFLLDHVGVDTADLHKIVLAKNSYTRCTKGSRSFNSKWRVYFDDKLNF